MRNYIITLKNGEQITCKNMSSLDVDEMFIVVSGDSENFMFAKDSILCVKSVSV